MLTEEQTNRITTITLTTLSLTAIIIATIILGNKIKHAEELIQQEITQRITEDTISIIYENCLEEEQINITTQWTLKGRTAQITKEGNTCTIKRT